ENAIPAEQKEVIFQVLRESLSNVRKHSRARNLWVVLDLSSAPWVMTVRDDGRGFDVRRVAEDPRKVGSYGLVGMRERAELMGGTLEIVSQTLEGTVVTLIGPAERAESRAAGASGYVLKDVDPVNLARSIQDAHAGRFQLDDALTRRVIMRLGSTLKRSRRPLAEPLTERETEILRMVVEGTSNKAIAGRLG